MLIASRSAQTLVDFLIERVLSAATRSSTPTRSTGVTLRSQPASARESVAVGSERLMGGVSSAHELEARGGVAQ